MAVWIAPYGATVYTDASHLVYSAIKPNVGTSPAVVAAHVLIRFKRLHIEWIDTANNLADPPSRDTSESEFIEDQLNDVWQFIQTTEDTLRILQILRGVAVSQCLGEGTWSVNQSDGIVETI